MTNPFFKNYLLIQNAGKQRKHYKDNHVLPRHCWPMVSLPKSANIYFIMSCSTDVVISVLPDCFTLNVLSSITNTFSCPPRSSVIFTE